MVEANESRLGQVFLNLLLNAAQAIPEGETERNEIRVSTRTDGRGHAVVEIRDTGGGIPAGDPRADLRPVLHDQVGGRGDRAGPLDLQRHPERAGRRDRRRQRDGEGELVPRDAAAGRDRDAGDGGGAGAASTSRRRAGRLLIVDDEPMILGALRRSLSSDYQVTCVGDGRRALERIRGGRALRRHPVRPDDAGDDRHGPVRRAGPARARPGRAASSS